MRPDGPRDPTAGPESGPESPFPIRLSGPVVKGFGRGSKELGIPTANIPPDGLSAFPDLQTGVYFGVTALDPAKEANGVTSNGAAEAATTWPCVLSIGYNPYYNNSVRSVEIHILARDSSQSSSAASASASASAPLSPTTSPFATKPKFHRLPDFYGTSLHLVILGFIRPEYDYVSVDALVDDIRIDCDVARASLGREKYAAFMKDEEGGGDDDERIARERRWLREF